MLRSQKACLFQAFLHRGQAWGHTCSCGLSLPARKTSKQVFVSYNLPNTSSSFELLVENRIKEEMQAFPEKF